MKSSKSRDQRRVLLAALKDRDPGVTLAASEAVAAARIPVTARDVTGLFDSVFPAVAQWALRVAMTKGDTWTDGMVIRCLAKDASLVQSLEAIRQTRFMPALPLLERLVGRARVPSSTRLRALDAYLAIASGQRARALLGRLVSDADRAIGERARRELARRPPRD